MSRSRLHVRCLYQHPTLKLRLSLVKKLCIICDFWLNSDSILMIARRCSRRMWLEREFSDVWCAQLSKDGGETNSPGESLGFFINRRYERLSIFVIDSSYEENVGCDLWRVLLVILLASGDLESFTYVILRSLIFFRYGRVNVHNLKWNSIDFW